MMRITLLTKADCGWCDDTDAALRRLAPELGLQVECVDVASEQGAAVAVAAGAPFPPAVLADGELVGFGRMSERRLRRMLLRRRAHPG